MTEKNNQLKAPERSYQGQLRQIAGDRQTSLAAYAADEIAWLRLELAQEQKRLDWALENGIFPVLEKATARRMSTRGEFRILIDRHMEVGNG